jgi:hypothetical protein
MKKSLLFATCSVFTVSLFALCLAGCGAEGVPDPTTSTAVPITTTTTSTTTTTTLPSVATPTFVLASGSYEANVVTVTIECTTSGASIYFTTDGSSPTAFAASPVYTGPFTIEASKVIKAIATREGMVNSAAASTWYDLYC